ncbi:MAG TPA: DUF6265 family protein [Gammaproteobacteria bacterium]
MPVIAFVVLMFAAQPAPPSLPAELDFLEGCWAGEAGGAHIEERYGSRDGGVLLGTVKTVRDDQLKFFEFLRIVADANGTWLQPYPEGKPDAPRFRLVQLEADKAAFENPEHDFPRRITYRLLPDGRLLTRVAGIVDGEDMVTEYFSEAVECRD